MLSNQLNTIDLHPGLFPMMFWMESTHTLCKWPRRKTWYHLSPSHPIYSKLRYCTSTHRPPMSSHSSCTSQWLPILTFWTSMNSCHFPFTSTSHLTSQSPWTSDRQTFLQSDILNLFKLFPAQTYTLVSTLVTLSFAKEGKSWKLA